MKLWEIIEYVEKIAPIEIAMEYDNAGLLVGRHDREIKRILTALDCTMAVVSEAKEKGCDLILCHHPVMFSGVKRITDDTPEGEMLLCAIENNIAIYAAHTNLDFADGGLNDYFLEKLGYCACDTIEGYEGRVFDAEGIRLYDLCTKIKDVFELPFVRICGSKEKHVAKCAVCTGSGKSLINAAAEKADCYITGDMGHHDVLTLCDTGCSYIEISHYDSEKIAMELLKKRILERFGDAEVFCSGENKNPLTIV